MMSTVCILLSAFNGEKYLREQITSLIGQKGVSFNIIVRDDGSTDSTISILKEYADKHVLTLIRGNNIGWRKSFMELLYSAPLSDYYAFCDQDDIWLPQKLKIATDILNQMPKNLPNLYCSNLLYYKDGVNYGPIIKSMPILSVQSAMLRCISAGCTMVFNRSLWEYVFYNRPDYVSAHDFWCYQVAALFGNVYYDSNSYILYRQHENNQIGMKIKKKEIWRKRINGIRINFHATYRQHAAKEILRLYGNMLSDEKRQIVERIALYDNSVKNRLSLCFDTKYTMGNIAQDLWLRIRILFGNI